MPIHPPHVLFYNMSIGFCLDSAARSIEVVADLMERVESDGIQTLRQADPQSVLDELQNIVVQAAAVSRYFWPIREKYESRGKQLRQMYDVTDSSPLKSRDLRNSIEHSDERLDEYLARDIVGTIYPHYLGRELPKSDVPHHFFRAYFADTGVFEMLGHRYELEPLARELWRLAGGKEA